MVLPYRAVTNDVQVVGLPLESRQQAKSRLINSGLYEAYVRLANKSLRPKLIQNIRR